ncbi:hypothetical protein BACCAP_01089 [Pseudoflavonifractor capillosus ATCC 29799]|uniref:Uncharacterized protein n=1 Tax=Pseudoflavonifractor capillosus ATCC 29799 TaxID=411467 RepID=A6NSB0_9FIRM|nr:hypothetical protein BACCAP_01089 [Pseudoflavonifractor capillosus ATCC 29799]
MTTEILYDSDRKTKIKWWKQPEVRALQWKNVNTV